jgi:hypothetical protein
MGLGMASGYCASWVWKEGCQTEAASGFISNERPSLQGCRTARIQKCTAPARRFPIQSPKGASRADILDKAVETLRAVAVFADWPCVPFGPNDHAPYIQNKRVKTPSPQPGQPAATSFWRGRLCLLLCNVALRPTGDPEQPVDRDRSRAKSARARLRAMSGSYAQSPSLTVSIRGMRLSPDRNAGSSIERGPYLVGNMRSTARRNSRQRRGASSSSRRPSRWASTISEMISRRRLGLNTPGRTSLLPCKR